MPNYEHDIRAAKLVDIPLIQRLVEKGTIMDSEIACTREVVGPHSVLLSSILPQRSVYTLVGRVGRERVTGQIRVKVDEHLAQMVYLAPVLDDGQDDTAWLHMIDAMAVEAGKRGAHILTGEVDEDSRLFVTMRTAGFAVYARQEIWRRPAGMGIPAHITPVEVTPEADGDELDIQLLYCNIVPRLVQAVAVPSSESTGLVYRQGGRIQGYIAISEGKFGTYVMPYLHPDILYTDAAAILAGALARVGRVERSPVYVCVRRYQDWLEEALTELGFEPYKPQAVMVRHISAGIRQVTYAPLKEALEVVPNAIRPPTSPMSKTLAKQGE